MKHLVVTILALACMTSDASADAPSSGGDQFDVRSGYRRYESVPPAAPADSEESYSAVQLLDGFGAVLVSLGEPVLFPIDQTKKCSAEGKGNFESAGCATLAFLFSPFMSLRDAIAGTGDLLTGGYFKISRSMGVFDYFVPADRRISAPASQ
ncbi:MAG: hypothetical protein IT290_02480 [Deltaproteobacteria bacterium]|nr:hypothetical protein [Deltaproteobacteria bacterium]